MRYVALLALSGLFLLPACPRKVKPDEQPTVTGVRVHLIDEGRWMVITRPLESDRSVEAGLAEALRDLAALDLPRSGQPMLVYEGDGRRSVAFPVAGRVQIPPPWTGLSVNAGRFASTTIEGGLQVAAAHNDDFVLEVRALGHEIVGPVFHRVLDDPRTTEPDDLRVQILAAISG